MPLFSEVKAQVEAQARLLPGYYGVGIRKGEKTLDLVVYIKDEFYEPRDSYMLHGITVRYEKQGSPIVLVYKKHVIEYRCF